MRKEFDIIVAGGGAAGVAAALAATRNGAKTLLIERDGYLGGTVTHCSLPTFCPFADPEKPIVRGIGMEILNRLKSEMELVSFYDDRPEKPMYNWFPIDGEALKRVLDEIILESGCVLLLHTDLIGCETKDGAITGLTCQTPGGRLTLSGKTYIDCTGNAALAAMAGCETRIGDENGEVQSATLCFTIANFDTERFVQYFRETGEGGNLENACRRALMDHAFPEGERLVSGFSFPAPGIAVWNFGHVFNIDPLDAVSLTQAEIAGRKQIGELLRFLRTYVPGAEKATLVSSGPVIGIRESRRVVGRYTLTREDYLRRANFDDAIASYCYPIDIHAGGSRTWRSRTISSASCSTGRGSSTVSPTDA